MVKNTQTIRRLLTTNCLSVFGHFVELVLKALSKVADNFAKFTKIGLHCRRFPEISAKFFRTNLQTFERLRTQNISLNQRKNSHRRIQALSEI